METNIIAITREALTKNIDNNVKSSGSKFFKEAINLYGVKTATVNKLAKSLFKEIKHLSKPEIFNLCDELWKSSYLEEAVIACNWSEKLSPQFLPEDINKFEKWIKLYVSNWASCDTLCNHTVGNFIQLFPQHIERLKTWAQSPNQWMRRASAVSLIIPARKGLFIKDIFEIADTLLYDQEDLVQKGYGWMLKAASQAHQKEVFDFVLERKATMPRTSLRYAIEKMPQELRKKAMEK
jgi:3-methyladenine DNA glycosylase AlkD